MGHGLEVKGGYKGLAQCWPVRLGFTVLEGEGEKGAPMAAAPVQHPTQLHAFFLLVPRLDLNYCLGWAEAAVWLLLLLLLACSCHLSYML